MKVAVLGAGIAGLAAARELGRSGAEAVVYEAESRVGGRCQTISLDGYTFDPAAISVTPRNMAIERVMFEELDTDGLIKIEQPIYAHDGRRTFTSHAPEIDQYCYVQGMQRLPELLADGVDVRLRQRVERIEEKNSRFVVRGESFDAVVLTVPTPDAVAMLEARSDVRKAHNTRYRRCISVVLGFDRKTDVPYHAVVADESAHPLNRLCIETAKTPGRAPTGHTALTVLFGPKYSKWHFESPEGELLKDALIDIGRILGEGYETPTVTRTYRWVHGIVETNASFQTVNPAGSRIVVAGDGVMGGRIEYAYDSGVKAAKLLTEL